MEQLLCTQCAAVTYSAAAKTLVEHGARCAACGGPLVLEPADPSEPAESAAARVAVPDDA